MGKQRIIIHIGPYKTGSTSIQSKLFNSIENLASMGICYEPDFGIADMRLGRRISTEESHAESLEGWWLGEGFEPIGQITNSGHVGKMACHIYSSETFCDSDFTKAREWASEIPYFRCDVICGIREPRTWLLSSFVQQATCSDLDFETYIAEHLASKKYFLSRLCSLWAIPRSKFRVIPHRSGKDIWIDFCRVAGITTIPKSNFYENKNETSLLIESLYLALLASYVRGYLPRLSDWAGQIEDGFLGRTLLDINVTTRPLYEWSRKWTEQDFLDQGIITTDLLPVMEEYRQCWLDDAKNCIRRQLISKNDLPFVRTALAEYKEQGSKQFIIPTKNFKEKLPLDANWEVIVRLIAMSVGMRKQGFK